MHFRPEPGRRISAGLAEAPGIFSLEVVLTFDAGPDPFAVADKNRPSLSITFEGEEWLRRTDRISAGTVIVINDMTGIKSGLNELHLRAFPVDEQYDLVRGARVRVLRDEIVIAEESLWSEPGYPIDDPFQFDIPSKAVKENSLAH